MVGQGDLLIALYGATSGDIAISKINGAINQAILCIRTDYNKQFIVSSWQKHTTQILHIYLQGGQGNLSADIIKQLPIYIPSEFEQQKLASFLNLIDARLATQSKIIDSLKSLSQAISQVLLGEAHPSMALGELCEIKKGEQINKEALSEQGQYYVMNGGVTPSGYYDRFNTEANTISISEGGNSCGYVQYNDRPFWSGGHCYTLKNISKVINHKYLFHYLKSIETGIMALRIGSGLPNIQKKDLSAVRIPLPPLAVQERIAHALDALLNKIELEETISSVYKRQKTYLLNNLFI